MTIFRALLLLNFILISAAEASEVLETFNSRLNFASGTAIWNQALGKVHPTLQVANFYAAPPTPKQVEVGDGSDGAFDISTYARFSVNGDLSGNKIRLDTNVFPILKLTSFHLAQGWVLEPVGDNPLIIYSLSDIRIEGQIWCNGHDGSAGSSSPGAGGLGRCGGSAGGNGGALNTKGDDGLFPHPSLGGGQGGNATGAGISGGGGGSWNTTTLATVSSNATASGGNPGSSSSDPEFNFVFGGAGGGGGAGSISNFGAGGGGGGGVVILHAARDVNIGEAPTSTTGFILVNGGNGGSPANDGGAGGGGGGGGVQVFSGGTINIYSDSGLPASNANSGNGGTNTIPSTGGLGGPGRSWFSSVAYNGIGFYTPSEESPLLPGNVEFSSATQTVTSQVIDLANRYVESSSASLLPGSSDYSIELAGSNDNFVSDDSGWTTNPALLRRKRYMKFRISITASNVSTPDMVDTAQIIYTPGEREDFSLKAAGCGRIEGGGGSPLSLLPLISLILLIAFYRGKAVHA